MKKRLFTIAALFLCSLFTFAQFSGSGSGTESDPYLIYNETQLSQMANFLNQDGVVFSLKKDLDLSGWIAENSPTQGWQPIGVEPSPFKGKLLGNGKTISGLSISRSGNSYVGFFGYLNGATITDLTIKGSSFVGGDYCGVLAGKVDNTTISNVEIQLSSDISGGTYTGGLVGCVAGSTTIKNGFVYGSVRGTSCVGGIIGQVLNGTVQLTNCCHEVSISGNGCTGGIIGELSSGNTTLTSCKSKGAITSSGDYTGGIIGKSNGCYIESIESCSHFGNISGINYIGGLVGAIVSVVLKERSGNVSHIINNSIVIGNINGLDYVGGLIGSNFSSFYDDAKYQYDLTNSYYCGDINASAQVGGLVGDNGGGTINKNYFSGNIYGTTNVGGIVGRAQRQLHIYRYAGFSEYCYANTTIKSNISISTTISASNSDAEVGRIYGSASSSIIGAMGSAEGNYALTQTKLIRTGVTQTVMEDLRNGSNIGPSLLKLKATYVAKGWDFENDWNILETECYPYKSYQAAPPVIESDLLSGATSISGSSLNGGTVYLIYKDNPPVSSECTVNSWMFTTEALQSGAQVRVYAEVAGMAPSYFTTTSVGFPGRGTEDDPYRIYTAEDLQGANKLGYYKLMNDIDLTSWINANSPSKGWIPVGLNSNDATYIDGDNHKVTGLWANTTDDYTGLFSNYSAGEIKNLIVEVATGRTVKGGNYTGILIGRIANGTITNCKVEGNVLGTQYVGGMTGYVDSSTTVSKCQAAVTVSASNDNASVGGLIGWNAGTVTKSKADATVVASSSNSQLGGLIGYTEGFVQMSLATGTVTASGSDSFSGGLVGYASNTNITDCYSTADVSGTDYNGGLVAYGLNTQIDKCYAKGDITGVNYGGGVVSQLDGADATLSNSVAANSILSLSAQSSWGSRLLGGYKNGAPEPEENNYALSTMQVSLNGVPQSKTDDPVEGIAKTAAELMSAATYQGLGWDYSTVWGVDEGEIYPYLLWEIDINPVAEITLDKTTLLIAVGKTETITANVLPLGATNKRLIWVSSNEAVATVENGEVTAVAVGTANITATSTDGSNITATCKVTVTANKDAAIAELQSIVDEAQNLYDNSREGENIGEYAAGSRAALLAAIRSVKAQISDTMSDEAISQCTTDINAAIEAFEAQKVTAGEDTDYSTIANTVYLEPVEAAAGGQVVLSVKMKNTAEIQGYQFDLVLPDGVTVATDEDGFCLIELSTERTTARKTDYFNSTVQADGSIRVLCGSSKGYTFEGTDGEVALITLNIDESIVEGDHPIILRDVNLSDKNTTLYTTDYLKSSPSSTSSSVT